MDTEKNKSFIQFSNPELVRSIFIVNESYDSHTEYKQKMKIETKAQEPHNLKDNERESKVNLSIKNFDVNIKDLEKKNIPYFVDISIQSKFKWSKENNISKDEEIKMLKVNAASLILSYIRPLLAQLTGMSRFSTENIPFIDFTNNLE